MYDVRPSTRLQKDVKRIKKKRGYDISLLTEIIKDLAAGKQLPGANRDHPLFGNFVGCREYHITADWILIYEQNKDALSGPDGDA